MRLFKLFSPIFSVIRLWPRIVLWHIVNQFRKTVTLHTKQGLFTLPVEINDPMSRSLYIKREYELDLVTDAMRHIRKLNDLPKGKGTVLDIGANNGVISIGMIFKGELDKAIAIEPEPRNFSSLMHNVEQNHFEDVISCLNYAVSTSKATLQFELCESNFGDHRIRKTSSDTKLVELNNESNRQVINVEADTLDNLLEGVDERFSKDISVVWIDVQGYEGHVFSGGKTLFSSGVPVVSEIWPYGIQRAGMSQEEFCRIVAEIWSSYWVKRRGKFVKYPIDIFYTYFDELGYGDEYGNVIFTM